MSELRRLHPNERTCSSTKISQATLHDCVRPYVIHEVDLLLCDEWLICVCIIMGEWTLIDVYCSCFTNLIIGMSTRKNNNESGVYYME